MADAPWELEVVTPCGSGLWHGDELEAAGLGDGRMMIVLRGRQKVTAVVQTCEAAEAVGGISVTQRGGLSRMWWASVVQLEIAPLGYGEVAP